MKLLVIPSWFPTKNNPHNGIFFKEQAEALARFGVDVSLLLLEPYSVLKLSGFDKNSNMCINKFSIFYENEVKIVKYPYVEFPKIKRIKKIQREILLSRIVKKYIKKIGKPDIIHLHSYFCGDIAFYFKHLFGIPYVITEHSSRVAKEVLNKSEKKYVKKVYREAVVRIGVSKELCTQLYKKYSEEFLYIPNMVNTDFFTIEKSKNKEKIYRFINIALLNDNKNQAMLIDAFYKAFSNIKNVKLVIVGDGPNRLVINNKIKELKIGNEVVLFGKASREEVKNLLQYSDAFVLSSKYETFGVSIIEAMSCGLPVVATRCGGPESIITNTKLGELVEDTSLSLSKGMLSVYSQKYNNEYIRNHIIENFSEEKIVNALKQVYSKAIIAL